MLINVSSLPKCDILIIDEGFGSLDDMNVEACNRLLVSLKKNFKNVAHLKPPASRADSSEKFVIAMGFRSER